MMTGRKLHGGSLLQRVFSKGLSEVYEGGKLNAQALLDLDLAEKAEREAGRIRLESL